MPVNFEMDECFFPDIRYVVFRRCTPAWRMAPQKLRIFDITYVIKGNARYTIDGKDYELSPGSLLCLPPGTSRKAITYSENLMHCFSINFYMKRPPKEGGNITQLPLPFVSSIGCRNDLISLFHEITSIWVDKYPGYHIKTAGVFLLILHRILELMVYNFDFSGGDYRLRKIANYITKHYSEKISVKKMASMVKLDTAYVGKLFKREMGVSLRQYLIRTRIRNAENMLRSGEYSHINIVAELCGYSDMYQFSRQFKAIMGFSPSQCMPKRDTL
jgi:AraC-like DNA-binding protein